MKILMKEDTPHYLVYVSKPRGHNLSHCFNFSLVHEVEPTTVLVSYKPYNAYRIAEVKYRNMNLPYQQYIYTITVSKNVNTNQLKCYTGTPNLIFSPTPWESEDSRLFRPWLSNVVDNWGLGSQFCFSIDAFSYFIDDKSLPIDPLEIINYDFLVKNYDKFWSQCFNADAGGVKTKDKPPYTRSVVAQFNRAVKLKSKELLDPESNWYTNIAIPLEQTKEEAKKILGS